MRLSGHDIICLSAVDWDDPRSAERAPLMGFLAEMNRVLFIDAPCSLFHACARLGDARYRAKWAMRCRFGVKPRRLASHLYCWTPPFRLPGDGLIARWRLRHEVKAAARALDLKTPILWLDPAHPDAEALIGACDEVLVVAHHPDPRRRLTRRERAVLAKADLAFVSSKAHLRALRDEVPHVRLAPRGCDFDRRHGTQLSLWEARCRELEGAVLDLLAARAKPSSIPLLVERIIRQQPVNM
ncbi:hypothetical protein J7643_09695 [bacterium]|nr:hypothetical protein [bacterium]